MVWPLGKTYLHLPLVSLVENTNYVWSFIFFGMASAVVLGSRIVRSYLKSKQLERQTPFDKAHMFMFRSTANMVMALVFTSTIYRFVNIHNQVLLIIVDGIFQWVSYTFVWSIFMGITIQFISVIRPRFFKDVQWDEEKLLNLANSGIQILLLIVSIIMAAAGELSPVYFAHKNMSEIGNTWTAIPRLIFFACFLIIGTIFRIILRNKSSTKEFGSNQLVSDKIFIGIFPYHLILVLARYLSPTEMSSYVLDFQIITEFGLIIFLPFLNHDGLKSYASRKFNMDLCQEWILDIAAGIELCKTLLFRPMLFQQAYNLESYP